MLAVLVLLSRAHPLGVERVEVDRGAHGQLLDLALAQQQPCALAHLAGGMLKRAGGGLDRREAPDPVRGALRWQVQHPVGDMQVLLPARPVCQPADRHLPEHTRQRTLMIALDRPALYPGSVSDPIHTPLALSAQVEMILEQAAHQLTPFGLQPRLQLPMLEPRRLQRAQPPDDLLQPLTRAAKRILARATAGREIACSSTSRALGLQEFISRRVKFAVTGAGVSDHVGPPFVVDVGVSNANFGTRERFSCDLSPPRQ